MDPGDASVCPADGENISQRGRPERTGRILTTEEIIDDGVSRTVGIYKPVGEGEPGIHCLSVVCVLESAKHSGHGR